MHAPTLEDLEPLVPHVTAIVNALLNGELEPDDVPVPAATTHCPWLDAVEQEIFAESPNESAIEARDRQREHAGFRLIRNMSGDDVSTVAWWLCARVLGEIHNARQQRLIDVFQRFEPIVPQRHSPEIH